MNDVMKKISRKKVAVASMIVVIVVFSVAYAIIQTRTAFAILTTPPPGIPGPYYVTAEAKIYGPVVDLAAIKSKMDGAYASDYTYVQWGTNPFYRVYVDNTLQEVYYGQMIDVMNQLSWNFAVETNLKTTYDNLKNVGAVDPQSILGQILYFGNFPGEFVVLDFGAPLNTVSGQGYVKTQCNSWRAVEAHALYSTWTVNLNGSSVLMFGNHDVLSFNATGGSGGHLQWNFSYVSYWSGGASVHFGMAIYFDGLSYLEYGYTGPGTLSVKNYTVIDSPGTGFVLKYVSPSSPVTGSTITVAVRLDPPSAGNMNITDLYPNTFAWASVDVLLEKFKIGVGFEESAYVNVVPTPDGSNMKFTIYYNQAPNILQSLLSDEYIYLTYSLRVPDVAGEYTLPAASMSYLIPTPQT